MILASRGLLGRLLGGFLGRLGGFLCRLEAILGVLERSWSDSGLFWAISGAFWGHLGLCGAPSRQGHRPGGPRDEPRKRPEAPGRARESGGPAP